MADINTTTTRSTREIHTSFLDEMTVRCEKMIQQYWADNPDLYRVVQLKHQATLAANTPDQSPESSAQEIISNAPDTMSPTHLLDGALRGAPLRKKIRASYQIIRQSVIAADAEIVPRTQAHNRKCTFHSLEEESEARADIVAAQIQSWRRLLPNLIRQFSRIPDYRRAKSVKHKTTVLMMSGVFAFIFRLSSRREMNRELTGPVIFNHLKKLFPEIDSIPHADTLARWLEKTNPQAIEAIHIRLIKDLIRKKKFRKLLIHDGLPVSIDGTQKLTRDGLLQDECWCGRAVGDSDNQTKQQYIYVVEANITLRNGLTIPLMMEYLYRDNNELLQAEGKQDSGTPRGVCITEGESPYKKTVLAVS